MHFECGRYNFMGKYEKDIHVMDNKLRGPRVDLDQEDDASGLLGVTLNHNNETRVIDMCWDILIERIVEALGLDDGMVTG